MSSSSDFPCSWVVFFVLLIVSVKMSVFKWKPTTAKRYINSTLCFLGLGNRSRGRPVHKNNRDILKAILFMESRRSVSMRRVCAQPSRIVPQPQQAAMHGTKCFWHTLVSLNLAVPKHCAANCQHWRSVPNKLMWVEGSAAIMCEWCWSNESCIWLDELVVHEQDCMDVFRFCADGDNFLNSFDGAIAWCTGACTSTSEAESS